MSLIAIVIPVHNRKDITLHCLEQLRKITSDEFKFCVIVIDDGSSDGTADAIIHEYPEVSLLQGDGTLWWAGGVNMGFRYAIENNFDFVYTINDDIEILEDTLNNLYPAASKHHAVYASIAVDPESGKITGSGYMISGYLKKMRSLLNGRKYDSSKTDLLSVDALSSMSTLIPIDIVADVGFYDEQRFPHNYSDIDYAIRMKLKSYELYIVPGSVIYTKGSGSNFHHFLLSKTSMEVFRSFFDMKYGHNIKTLFNSSLVRSNYLYAIPVFFNRLFPYVAWFALSVFTSRQYLRKVLKNTNRI